MPDFRQARHPSRVYRGSRENGAWRVTVLDSAQQQGEANPRVLTPEASQGVTFCCDTFCWGDVGDGSRQLAIALLLDVTGDPATALRWFELFTEKYVGCLPPQWAVPELDIALWLYCFQNARPGV
jgi:hypothetical protein